MVGVGGGAVDGGEDEVIRVGDVLGVKQDLSMVEGERRRGSGEGIGRRGAGDCSTLPYRCCFRPRLRSSCGRCIAGRRGRRLWLMEVCGGGRGPVSVGGMGWKGRGGCRGK